MVSSWVFASIGQHMHTESPQSQAKNDREIESWAILTAHKLEEFQVPASQSTELLVITWDLWSKPQMVHLSVWRWTVHEMKTTLHVP